MFISLADPGHITAAIIVFVTVLFGGDGVAWPRCINSITRVNARCVAPKSRLAPF
jgi:hypothetical protein